MPGHVGVIGTGGWSGVHLGALTESRHVDRVTLAGRNEAALAQRARAFPVVKATANDPRRLLDDPSIELIHIVLPHHLHAETAIAALDAGKHVICEKPGSTSLADWDRVAATARRRDRRFLVVMNHLYNPVVARVRQTVDSGALGRVFLSVENSFSDAGRNYRDPVQWRTTVSESGGGILIDGGFHMVYRHIYYLGGIGSPIWVTADTAQLGIRPDGQVVAEKGEDFVSITVGFAGPLRIQWAHAWTLPAAVERSRQCFLAGTEATLELTDRPETPLQICSKGSRCPLAVDRGPQDNAGTTHECLLDYLECVFSGRDPEAAKMTLARKTLAVILGAYSSGRTGHRVDLVPANDQ